MTGRPGSLCSKRLAVQRGVGPVFPYLQKKLCSAANRCRPDTISTATEFHLTSFPHPNPAN
jgi:hypothetical protein